MFLLLLSLPLKIKLYPCWLSSSSSSSVLTHFAILDGKNSQNSSPVESTKSHPSCMPYRVSFKANSITLYFWLMVKSSALLYETSPLATAQTLSIKF